MTEIYQTLSTTFAVYVPPPLKISRYATGRELLRERSTVDDRMSINFLETNEKSKTNIMLDSIVNGQKISFDCYLKAEDLGLALVAHSIKGCKGLTSFLHIKKKK